VLFEVRAADATLQVTTVHLEAIDAADARRQALRLKLVPVSVQPHRERGGGRGARFDRVLFAEELQMLLSAGLPLVDAIEGLAERQTDQGSRSVLVALTVALRQGERLSSAMARQPAAFPALFVGIVRAAERTSNLAASLSKYVTYESHLRLLRERLTSAAIYPAILLVAGSAVTLFLLTYVVPRFAAVYDSSGCWRWGG
jgi:general secretion pathway protein F